MADGSMAGSVINIANNQPIGGAKIDAQPEGGGAESSATSGDDGKWGPIALAAGVYDVTVTAEGFESGVYPGIVVIEDVTTTLPFALHPSGYFD